MLSDTAFATTSDEDLACRAQAGCAASFEQLLRRFQTPVLHFLRHRGLAADAEDVAQETFLRAFKNLHRYDRRWAFSVWIFTIARRLGANHVRRDRPAADTAAVRSVAAADSEPLDALVAAEGRRRLWSLAAEILSEEQNTAIWLHYVEEMPLEGIGRVLGRSRSAVKLLMFRARKKLIPFLDDFNDERRKPMVSMNEASHD